MAIKSLVVPSIKATYIVTPDDKTLFAADIPVEQGENYRIVVCESIRDRSQEYEDHTEYFYELKPWHMGVRVIINVPVIVIYEREDANNGQ